MTPKQRTVMITVRATPVERQLAVEVAARLSLKRGRTHTVADVIREGIALVAKREKV